MLTPKVPTGSPVQTYFVELQLKQNGTLIDRNVYWLSTQPDVVNWTKTLGQPQGTLSQYANLHGAADAAAVVGHGHRQHGQPGRARTARTGPPRSRSPTPRRPTVAFLLRADMRRGTASGQELSGDNELQSSLWQNNDITLFPGESQTLTVTWNSADLQGATAVVSVSGWNVAKIDILA